MSWIYLMLAGIFEIGFATTLKLSNNFTKLWPSIIFIISITLSFYFLEKSIEKIPIGTAYAIWTGIGAVGTVFIGILFFKEPASVMRIFFLVTLVGSVIGLKLTA
ncbi:sugE protein [Leptospira ryugenii]|uniref:Guanidinium exporter n=1 Tax=Leptospira ryugenii TaxID=1917863 RepID=A0A2P2E2S7_9LEPT|nr:multidrug efflux SMR transporter [Leptospira ryugenii]GBF51213.1 sugE protein [Leptospira ryugenii]